MFENEKNNRLDESSKTSKNESELADLIDDQENGFNKLLLND